MDCGLKWSGMVAFLFFAMMSSSLKTNYYTLFAQPTTPATASTGPAEHRAQARDPGKGRYHVAGTLTCKYNVFADDLTISTCLYLIRASDDQEEISSSLVFQDSTNIILLGTKN